jgi:phytoene synthase
MIAGAKERSKRRRDESFPVASLVLSSAVRGAVIAFYDFARMADDIADEPDLTSDEKLARLGALETALVSGAPEIPEAERLRAIDSEQKAGLSQARDLLRAFRQDATKDRYQDWAELIEYCRLSANPVGRFLLALHGEQRSARMPADALCTALQILNHIQDCARDRERLNRIYIPTPWMRAAASEAAFFDPTTSSARRRVLDAMLDRVDALLDQAQILPQRLQDRRLRAQSIATHALARCLSRRLRRADPVIGRVQVSKLDMGVAFAQGVCGIVRQPSRCDSRITAAVVRRSGSSFRLGMRSLVPERRRAIHAVYAFCRSVDDIADGAAPASEKRAFLSEWRRELDRLHGTPATPIGRELARASRRFGLPLEEFHALLDGMETDSSERIRLADDDELLMYSRRVAGSVGVLSIRIFGLPEAESFALDLGRTLQFVNILRDVDEDAARERVYVPLSRLARLGLNDAPAVALVADPRFARVCESLAEEARAGFAAADAFLPSLDRRALKPAILMMENYRRVLDRLEARGWGRREGKLRLSPGDRLHLITRAMRPA